ncbi:MAG: nucleotidyltransferase family protein [Acidobacteriota bacterium]|nr:nucleotidyltransferase family protein [Acidobacteriota bacterium]
MDPKSLPAGDDIPAETLAFYRQAMTLLRAAELPFLVGGAYAFARYTGIVRHTKDFDVFIRERDFDRALGVLQKGGFRVERSFPHWLGKAFSGDDFVDLIWSSGNGIARVDDIWFEQAPPGEVLGMQVKLCPAEEMIWSKAFIMERERYDGADVAHILQCCAEELDWPRLLARFGAHWRVLLSHLILFGYIYPADAGRLPATVLATLTQRLRSDEPAPEGGEPLCRGTILSRAQYLVDLERGGYHDARLRPGGTMSAEDIESWTAAIADDGPEAGASAPLHGQGTARTPGGR